MNPKNLNVYQEGLVATQWEKLFFYDRVFNKSNLNLNNKIIIDFGCGEGSTLSFLYRRLLSEELHNVLLIGIEPNANLKSVTEEKLGAAFMTSATSNRLTKVYELLNSLEDLEKYFEQTLKLNDDREVIFICSSVLHEVGSYQKKIAKFVKKYVSYLVIRDMYIDIERPFTDSQISKIIEGSEPKRLGSFVRKYGLKDNQILHYLLKYTYVENWDTELLEDYTSVNWSLFEKLGHKVFDFAYLQEWRRERVQQDFDINLNFNNAYTHRQLVIKVDR